MVELKTIFVTGGAGFIGSELIRQLITETNHQVINIDKLTYAANLESLATIESNSSYHFEQVDITDGPSLKKLYDKYQPDWILHLAAESHVDRSIEGPSAFMNTNILGTFQLLESARAYWLARNKPDDFRFLHVSTDEVYGSLGATGYFTEQSAYAPHSPYSASKAASDHLARAWFHTYDLPVLVSNCSNNYGPYQFPEKLIPHMIIRALSHESLPVYGSGENIRDWLFVSDHVRALRMIATAGTPGETYNVGGSGEMNNLDLVNTLCCILDELKPKSSGSYASQIEFVRDRPGHDFRYAIDARKIKSELHWQPHELLASGLKKTVAWYLDNTLWWQGILDNNYQTKRLGLIP